METLLLRAVFAPCLVLLVSLAARRLGPSVGGRLLGTPTTTGPFLLLLALADGTRTAAGSLPGSIAGQAAVAGFCVAYGRLAPRLRPARTLAAALAFAAVAELIAASCTQIWLTAAFDATIVLAGLLTPPPAASAPASIPASVNQPSNISRRWEIPARMAISGAMVLIAMIVAGVAGPFVGGLLSSLPVLLMVMAPSIHRSAGSSAAAQLTRGALTSGFATLGFLLVLYATLEPLGALPSFALALAALALIDQLTRSSLTRLPRLAAGGRRHGIRAGLQ
jgi:hypothetical protein